MSGDMCSAFGAQLSGRRRRCRYNAPAAVGDVSLDGRCIAGAIHGVAEAHMSGGLVQQAVRRPFDLARTSSSAQLKRPAPH